MPNPPREVICAVAKVMLPTVSSIHDIPAIALHTQIITWLRSISQRWRRAFDCDPSFFRLCFANLALPRHSDVAAAVELVDSLRPWCDRADYLYLVLRLSESTPSEGHDALDTLLCDICGKIQQIHLSVPPPNNVTRGTFMLEISP